MEDISRLIDTVMQKFGRIDILVNNAATNPTVDPAIDYTERAWDAIMNLNLKGLFFLSQGVAKIMKGQSVGSILNIASVEGMRPSILSVYGISKAGVIHATKVMAKEWAVYKIRVKLSHQALPRTRFAEFWWNDPELLKTASSMTPLGRTRRARLNGRGGSFPCIRCRRLYNGTGACRRRRYFYIAWLIS
jgi:NAD(P)-dependent dehydrogenase (short-subunit alcohol dehydrogenase family)